MLETTAESEEVPELPNLEVSFSSLSVAPTRKSWDAVIPQLVTAQTFDNMARLHTHLGVNDPSISLHAGYLTRISQITRLLDERGIRITSIDRPDSYPIHDVIKNIWDEFREGRQNETPVTIGRRLHNVGTDKRSLAKVIEGIRAMRVPKEYWQKEPVVIRTHAGHWTENGGISGDRLRDCLYGTNTVLAVEIFAASQTQVEYRQLIGNLARFNQTLTPVLYDLDLGHLAEANFLHQDQSEGVDPIAFTEQVIKEEGQLVALTSLNTYRNGDRTTHLGFLDGESQLRHLEMARVLGEGVRCEYLKPAVLTVIESMPFEFDRWLTPDGALFMNRFRRQFNDSTGVDSATQNRRIP